jgi:hypothetical protein
MRAAKTSRVSVVFLLAIASSSLPHDLTEEIKSLKSDITTFRARIDETRKNIASISSKAKADSLSYSRYLQESQVRSGKLTAERDSLIALSNSLQNRRDSLMSAADAASLLTVSYKRQTDNATAELRASCMELITVLEPFALYNISKQISALRFLEGELSAGTIEAAEGLERYWQIASQIEKASQKIETWTGPSPVQSIKGEARFLRLGFIWLACIDNNNTGAFLWNSTDGDWAPVNQEEQITTITKAIKLSTGMAAPQLVALPVSLKILPNKKGNEQ